ncbi:unnamed protein product [Rhizoctonia solani]|uniref:Jacalin-type lectin domain-containing protein n=2 Tax=Rhizoctonia solani TaxID=456999 RepID=A0A8H2WUM4_9AGAM|nr:transmembrane protein, putative [Rhizoctonia solani AG-3 Rhs1AP]CAE6409416.1 unnamed protein product [Rhizoctonia solani]CAE6475675.1 unnamed protein product [Rhizoctonia solani]
MSKLSGLSDLPASVGGQPIPDFINFEIVGDGKLPARHEVPAEFDFSIKKSPVFGQESGEKFDEGAVWYPLREVHFALSDQTGLGHYRGHYQGRATAPAGKMLPTDSIGLKLNKSEYIVGFRAYSNKNVIEGVRVWTSDGAHRDFGKVQGAAERGKDPEAFFVPPDHEVVNFFGHTNDDGHIHGLGVSYTRRLASLSTQAPAPKSSGSSPTLTAFLSQTYLDAGTQHSWAMNDMETITRKQDQANKDLAPLYERIDKEGDDAWTVVRDPDTKQEYYIVCNEAGMVWSYVTDQPSTSGSDDVKTSIISIGSYSKTQNMLGLSGYIWDSIPATAAATVIGFAVTILIQPLITQGIAWGIAFAATQLATYLGMAGAPALAALVPASVVTTGGLVIAGVIGVFVAFGVLAIFGSIWKKFWLVVNIYNFDPEHEWRVVDHYGDNSLISNGEWGTKFIATFKPADSVVFPPGFDPQKPLESVVTYLSVCFENDSTFMEGLGEAISVGRSTYNNGFLLKYNIYYLYDNEINVESLLQNPDGYPLRAYYDKKNWVKAHSMQVASGLVISAYTPELSGSDDNDYYYHVCIGLPQSVV